MVFHYQGNYDGNPEHLKNQRLVEGSVKFKEPPLNVFAIIGNIFSVVLVAATLGLQGLRAGKEAFSILGFVLSILTLVPHEFLHGCCFKKDVYMYLCLSKGMLFVAGDEDMTKGRYVFMSMLPNLVFGFLPYILFMIWPQLNILGTMGAFCIAYGAGDYINVFNALTQMPRHAVTYMHQTNSYWHMP